MNRLQIKSDKSSIILAALAFIVMSISLGCHSKPTIGNEKAVLTQTPEVSLAHNKPMSFPEYRLGFGDVIDVKFFDNKRFNETATVRPDGRITLEKVGEVLVSGITPLQLDSMITSVYSQILRNPEVSVFVREFAGYQVYVLGEVNSPGGYPIQRDMTLVKALALAGGVKNGAKTGSVIVARNKPGEAIEAIQVNFKQSLKTTSHIDSNHGQYLQPGDVIYVPRTTIANVSTFLKQVYDGVLPPVDIYLRIDD